MIWSTLLKGVYRALYGPLPEPAPPGRGRGLVLVADGVGGLDLCGTGLCHAAARAGLPHQVRVVCWGHGPGRWHRDLTRVERHVEQAAALAAEVGSFRAQHPDAPVFLLGKSGGSGIVVRALEALPPGSVERAVLLAPALSPGYDLSAALRAVRRDLVAFYSPLDLIVLGLGTRLFGTIDRVRSVSAGLTGFLPPPAADEIQYRKLRQVRWRPAMGTSGYLGGHIGPDSPAFLRRYVVPLLEGRDETAGDAQAWSSRARSAPIT